MASLRRGHRCYVCLNLDKPTWDHKDTDILKKIDDGYYKLKHWFSFKDAAATASSGCNGCRILLEILRSDTSEVQGQAEGMLTGDVFLSKRETRIKMGVAYRIDHRLFGIRELRTTTGATGRCKSSHNRTPKLLCSWLQSAHSIAGDTGSDEAVLRVQSWLERCIEEHDKCRASLFPALPTRVLLLEEPNKVRLYVTKGEVGPYACLSHCWGERRLIQTLTTTFAQYQQGIPWEDLPKTFKDAISFTYRLGISCLWIDSLCIIQDSLEDWLREGSNMSHIYRDSHVTLAAVWAADASGGCFVTSNPSHKSKELALTAHGEEPSHMFFREPLSHSILKRPLDVRGWAFQERLLSPRMVRFEEQEISWECSHSVWCECSGIAHDKGNLNRELSMAYECLKTSTTVPEIQNAWEALVQEYSRKELTDTGDIFPALQGLAKVVSPVMGDYLAGHWSRTLLSSLCWLSADRRIGRRNTYQWRAPTWSWASIPGAVKWCWRQASLGRSLCTVLNAQTVPTGDDPTGPLISGKLVILGKVIFGTVLSEAHRVTLNNYLQHIDFGLYDRDLWGLPIKTLWDRDIASPGADHVAIGARVSALQLYDSINEDTQYWLILRTTDTGMMYERIGLMQLFSSTRSGISFSQQRVIEDFELAAQEAEITIV